MNPLFQSMFSAPQQMPVASQQNPLSQVMGIVNMLKSGNPSQIGMALMQKNPQFAEFMRQNQGKTPQQYAKEHGLDFSQIQNMM